MLNYPKAMAPNLRMLSCVPSFLTLSGSGEFEAGIRGCIRQCSAVQSADWGREFYYLEKYDLRLFDRAGEQMREALERLSEPNIGEFGVSASIRSEWVQMSHLRYGHLPTFRDWTPGRYSSAPFSEQRFEKWFARVTDPKFVGPAEVLLGRAWIGASHVVNAIVPTKNSFDDLKDFFARFDHPLFDQTMKSDSIARSLGLKHAPSA
jgi:hypothetical protein